MEQSGQFKPWEKCVGIVLLVLVIAAAVSVAKPEWFQERRIGQETPMLWVNLSSGETVNQVTSCIVGNIVDALAGDYLVMVNQAGPPYGFICDAEGVTTGGPLPLSAGQTTAGWYFNFDGFSGVAGVNIMHYRADGTPVYTDPDPGLWVIVGDEFIRMGASVADAALWDDATKVRSSKYSNYVGGSSYDAAFSQTGTPFQYLAPVLTGGDSYTAYMKVDGHTWDTQTGLPGHASVAQAGVFSLGLPWSTGSDDWETWLGSAGAKTITIELRKASDGTLVASDTAAFTMFIPAIVLATDPAATVPDVFDATVSIDECYYLHPDYNVIRLLAVYSGTEYDIGLDTYVGDAGLFADMVVGSPTTVAADLAAIGTNSLTGDFTYYGGVGLPAGVFTLRARLGPLADTDVSLSHVETYTVTITAPTTGAVLLTGFNTVSWTIAQGWYENSSFRVYAYRNGAWAQVGSDALKALPTRTGYSANVELDVTDTALKVEWGYLSGVDWIVLDSDTVAVTVESDDGGVGGTDPVTGEPEPPTGGDGEPLTPTTPWVDLYYPAADATVAATFTAYVNYGQFTATAAGTLKIVAVGPQTVTLYNATAVLATTGQLVVPLDFGTAAVGDYTLYITLTGTGGETASDTGTVTLATGGSTDTTDPTVTITSPDNGDSVSGTVSVVVTATDDVGVWRVALTVDNASPQYLYAPTSGTNTYTFTWNSGTYANGSHTITATARDANGNSASDSILVNLANAQADTTKYLFTKQLGYSAHAALNAESANWRDRTLLRSIEVLELPATADLPADPRQRYNLFVGYHIPGDSVTFSAYRLVTPGQSHTLTPAGTSIRWGIKAVPQRSLAEWDATCANIIRLALSTDGAYVYALCTTPHSLRRLTVATGYDEEWADLTHLATAPTDMVVCDGKVFINSGDKLEVIDETDGDLAFQVLLPSPDEVTSIDALASDGTTVYVAATLAAGGSRLYGFTYADPETLCDHDDTITAMAVLGGTLYVGNDAGEVLTYASGALSLEYSTGEASVVRLATVGSTIYAGTSTSGKVFRKVSSWGEGFDAGFTATKGLASLSGYAYCGGTGTGGGYLWYEQTADGWAQTQLLTNATAVNDLLTVTYGDAEQLFAACTGNGTTSYVYRLELAAASDLVCDTDPPDLLCKILKD